ncbi:hypothetical protein BBJ28_00019431 [Nothophytophthora sp. Chile5]|nr:hypothetical protein BBJ28_00019431 [Nothophytophthora sp. Chile5]
MQRVRTLKLTTLVHPDALVPYLYGDRGGRSINAIMSATGCTIDYCALSPDELERSPQTNAYVMNFLVSAETTEKLEEGIKQLRKLVERVQVHLQKKARVPGSVYSAAYGVGRGHRDVIDEQEEQIESDLLDQRHYFAAMEHQMPPAGVAVETKGGQMHMRRVMRSPSISGATPPEGSGATAVASKREPLPRREVRWKSSNAATEVQAEEAWGVPPVPRMYYSTGGRRFRRERPRYTEIAGVEPDEKHDFDAAPRRVVVDSTGAEFMYLQQQRGDPGAHFVARHRPRQPPEQARWAARSYTHVLPRDEAEYVMYPAPPVDGDDERAKRMLHSRQSPRQFQEVAHQFPPGTEEYSLYEDETVSGSAGFDETVDLTQEAIGINASGEYVSLSEHHQALRHQTRPRLLRRGFKRPLGSMRSDEPPPPPIYRQRMPYIYEYADDEDREWMSEDEEVAMSYGYPAQNHHMDVIPPRVLRRRRYGSAGSAVNVQQWSSLQGLDRQMGFKRRRVPYHELPLDDDDAMSDVSMSDHTVSSPRSQAMTAVADRLSEAVGTQSGDTSRPGGVAHAPTDRATTGVQGAVVHAEGYCSDGPSLLGNEGGRSPAIENTTSEDPSMVQVEALSAVMPASDQMSPAIPERESGTSNIEAIPAAGHVTAASEHDVTVSGHGIEGSESTEVGPKGGRASDGLEQEHKTTMKIPSSSPEEVESRIASSPSSVAQGSSYANATTGTAMEEHGSEHITTTEPDVPLENDRSTQVAALSSRIDVEAHLHEPMVTKKPTIALSAAASALLGVVANDTIRINNHVITSLGRMNTAEAAFVTAKDTLTTQEERYRGLEGDSKCRRRLEVLCGIVYDLQCQISSRVCGLDRSQKHEVLAKLDSSLANLLTTEKTLQDKVGALQASLEHVLSMDGLLTNGLVPVNHDVETMSKSDMDNSRGELLLNSAEEGVDENVEDTSSGEGDGWFEGSALLDPVNASEEEENFVAHISPKEGNLKLDGEYFAIKLEDGVSPQWPRRLPSFVWSFLARLTSSDPQSYVMRVAHKRLLEEIAKGDPYYYLQPTDLSNGGSISIASSLRSSPSSSCEFGCRGASAVKWERKLVSQISSRMKSFDNVAYSLARSSGGKEVLNRKKMNSIIRKLHLVAMQLHSLVSHLYCVKGQMTCKEVDSLPIALNNSHFERKMGVYKSRLKLVVPHKYQQQHHPQQSNGSNEPAEELLRDTYEFFPELLLCVDIWGYNYREDHVKRRVRGNDSLIAGDRSGLATSSERALFPLGFFREVEGRAFDFEHDGNGLLRRVCDELLNIVCLWNDFKWADNLEAVSLERVVALESDVTASILKILELHAHHMQALWAMRLLDNPERLRSVHFTQLNAYYSDRSRGSLTPSARLHTPKSSVSKVARDGDDCEVVAVDDHELVTDEMMEQRAAEEYWTRKLGEDDDAMEVDESNVATAGLLSAEAICSWDPPTLASYLLRWSDVYTIRTEVEALSSVVHHMLKQEGLELPMTGNGNDASDVDDADIRRIDRVVGRLLAVVRRTQVVNRDAVVSSEKLALHSASHQLLSEKKQTIHSKGGVETSVRSSAMRPARSPSASPEGDAPSIRTRSSTTKSASVSPDESDGDTRVAEVPSPSADEDKVEESSARNDGKESEENGDRGGEEDEAKDTEEAPEQPELKDLIQLLAATKRKMQELCSHRPRSARVREKLQTQSVQLARQTVEIFRNITHMYAAQRR